MKYYAGVGNRTLIDESDIGTDLTIRYASDCKCQSDGLIAYGIRREVLDAASVTLILTLTLTLTGYLRTMKLLLEQKVIIM